MPRDDYREEMRQKVLAADGEAKKRKPVSLEASRQQVLDLAEAFNQLNSMNPWYRGVARRLRDLSRDLSAALDRAEDEQRKKEKNNGTTTR